MINVREIDRTFRLWSYVAVTGFAGGDVERSTSVMSKVVQRCQPADGLFQCRFQPGAISHTHT